MRKWIVAGGVMAGLLAASSPASAGVTVYEDGDQIVEIGGRIQVQYRLLDLDKAEAVDRLFFRRLRPYVQGSVTRNWVGRIQFDFGEALDSEEVQVKDAYMRYLGWGKKAQLSIGNAKPAFAREYLTSSKRQQFVERLFPGDHNFGSLDRTLGIHVSGQSSSSKVTWGATLGAVHHDPLVVALDLDTPVNNKEDWNEGGTVAARVDFHPMGKLRFSQGDFHTDEWKATIGVAAFGWKNDGDNNTYTDAAADSSTSDEKADLEETYFVEASAGLRGKGLSFDIEYHRGHAKTVVSEFTGGIYKDGESDLDVFGTKAGYMVLREHVELAAAYDFFDGSGYEKRFERVWLGANWFLDQHKMKFQLSWRRQRNIFGVSDLDGDNVLVQAQFFF